MRTYVHRQAVTFKGPAVKVKTISDSQVTPGTIRFKGTPDVIDHPAIVTHQFGKGRVVYFAAGLDAGYYLYSYPYQRLESECR